MPAFLKPRAVRTLRLVRLTAAALLLAGCTDGGLDATQVADRGDTADLVTAVATEGVSQEGARAAAVRVARDTLNFAEIVEQGDDQAERFFAEILDADSDLLAVLVAVGVESLVAGVAVAASDLTTISPEQAAIVANQRFFLEAGAFQTDNIFRALRTGAQEAGIDDETRWAVLLGVLYAARDLGVSGGSFVDELDDDALRNLTPEPFPPAVPKDGLDFGLAVDGALADLFVDVLYGDPVVRQLLSGDDGISRAAFAEDPFITSLVNLGTDGLGSASLQALAAFLDGP